MAPSVDPQEPDSRQSHKRVYRGPVICPRDYLIAKYVENAGCSREARPPVSKFDHYHASLSLCSPERTDLSALSLVSERSRSVCIPTYPIEYGSNFGSSGRDMFSGPYSARPGRRRAMA